MTYRSTNNSAQWVPGPLIKPVEEVVEAILHHVVGGTVVKPDKVNLKQLQLYAGFCQFLITENVRLSAEYGV